MTEPGKKQRRTILAERSAQFKVIRGFLLHALLYTVLTLVIIMLPSVLRLTVDGFTLEEQFAASREFLLFDVRVVPVLLVMLVMGSVHFLFLTHRIFGPLVRLRGTQRRWREGAWPRAMKVRRSDFHAALFDEFSQSTTALGADVAAARELVRQAAVQARSLAAPGGAQESGQIALAIAEDCRLALERLDRWQRR